MRTAIALVALVVLVLPCALAGCATRPTLAPGEERVEPDEDAVAAEMIELIREVTLARARERGGPVRRFNQAKTLGCFDARLEVPALEPALAQGVFATPASYPAYVRFANASQDDDREPDLRGFSIAVRGLADGREQHFLFNSHPALFAAEPHEFLAFMRASAEHRVGWFFFNPFDSHLGALVILTRARQRHGSVFDISYWSTTPSRFGSDPTVAVKHAVVPCSPQRGAWPPGGSPDFLQERMAERLDADAVCFDFMVQFQGDPARMPIEDASVVWSEVESPLRRVGRIVISRQSWRGDDAMRRCEAASFDPWTGIRAHRPLGGINRVRRTVYPAAAAFRREANAR